MLSISMHTFFMRSTIDVVYLDRSSRVVKAVFALLPVRINVGPRGTRSGIRAS